MIAASTVVEAGSAPLRNVRRIGTLPAALAAMLVMLAVLTVRNRFSDPDMWWHLRDGQTVATTHHIPLTDLYSYTTHQHFTPPQEWLTELSIYGAYAAGGFRGLMLWECAAAAAVLLAGFLLCFLHAGDAKLALLGALLIWFFGTSGFAVRPHVFGYLLLIVELTALHLGRTRDARWFFALPPLFALWVNSHGSFALGLAVAAIHLVASFVTRDCGPVIAAPWTAGARRNLGVAFACSCAALLLNPAGFKLITYPLYALFVPNLVVRVVTEWQPLGLDGARAFGLYAVVAAVVMPPVFSQSKLYAHELLLVAAGAYLAVAHQRLLFAFGILVAPTAARLLSRVWQENRKQSRHPGSDGTIIACSLLIAYVAFPSTAQLEQQVRRFSPVDAVNYVRSHQLTGPMLNEFNNGGYLIWALPEHPVFIDGRADVYEWSGVLAEYARFATLSEPANLLLDRYHVHFCLLARDSPLAGPISRLPGWRRVYTDDVSTIFERTQ